MTDRLDLAGLTAQITAAYVSHNRVTPEALAGVIAAVHEALSSPTAAPAEPVPERMTVTPAQIRRSITDDWLISFIDGRPYKTLKRHLAGNGLDPGTYRERYGLPDDYPMVSPAYARARSQLAKFMGLGRQGRGKASRARGARAART